MSEVALIDKYIRNVDGVVSSLGIQRLNQQLGEKGEFILMMGNCAEVMDEVSPEYVNKFEKFYEDIEKEIGRKVLKIGRFAGQFGKTRGGDFDDSGNPIYRGDIYNGFDLESRDKDEFRKVLAYQKSKFIVGELKSNIYTSHEIFDLEYEEMSLKEYCATSGHMLWLGNKNFLSEGHLDFLAKIKNPVGIKIGENVEVNELLYLINKLRSNQEDKRIILISRIGNKDISRALPVLLRATKDVVWICDPMHGNNKKLANGNKVRFLDDISDELRSFKQIYEDICGESIRGVMLEANFGKFIECLNNSQERIDQRYESYCDPRLNYAQVIQLIEECL